MSVRLLRIEMPIVSHEIWKAKNRAVVIMITRSLLARAPQKNKITGQTYQMKMRPLTLGWLLKTLAFELLDVFGT